MRDNPKSESMTFPRMGRGRRLFLSDGFTIMELIVVVAILGVISLAAVPFAELSFIRLKEAEFQTNLDNIRIAIQTWRQDCETSVLRQFSNRGQPTTDVGTMPDSLFFPPSIDLLAKPPAGGIILYYPPGVATATFYPRKYLNRLPDDPFVGGQCWVQHYASAAAGYNPSSIYSQGVITPAVNNGTGVFDVSAIPATDTRRGFVQAIDGSRYEDW